MLLKRQMQEQEWRQQLVLALAREWPVPEQPQVQQSLQQMWPGPERLPPPAPKQEARPRLAC